MKELTLENVQVDCRELTEEQVKEMANVFENNGFIIGNLAIFGKYYFLSHLRYRCCTTNIHDEKKTTITYEKFMELFRNKYEVKMVEFDLAMCRVQVDNEEQAIKIQELGFKQGYYWKSLGKQNGKKPRNLMYPYYFFDSRDNSITYSDDDFNTDNYREVHFNDIFIPKYEVAMIAEKPQEFQNLVESLNEELTEEAYKETKPQHYSKGIDTFARMEANCTKEECLAFAKGNIDKYNWRTKRQDLEDYKKIIAYANWAIKLLENGK